MGRVLQRQRQTKAQGTRALALVLGEKGEERERGQDCGKQRESDAGQSEKDERHHAEAVGRQRDPYAARDGTGEGRRERDGDTDQGRR